MIVVVVAAVVFKRSVLFHFPPCLFTRTHSLSHSASPSLPPSSIKTSSVAVVVFVK